MQASFPQFWCAPRRQLWLNMAAGMVAAGVVASTAGVAADFTVEAAASTEAEATAAASTVDRLQEVFTERPVDTMAEHTVGAPIAAAAVTEA